MLLSKWFLLLLFQASEELEDRERLAVMAASGLQEETEETQAAAAGLQDSSKSTSMSFMEQYTQVLFLHLSPKFEFKLKFCFVSPGNFCSGNNLGLGSAQAKRRREGVVERKRKSLEPGNKFGGKFESCPTTEHAKDRQCSQFFTCKFENFSGIF